MEIIVFVVVIWIVPMYIAVQQGKAKNRNGWAWGLVFGWIGVLALALLPTVEWD